MKTVLPYGALQTSLLCSCHLYRHVIQYTEYVLWAFSLYVFIKQHTYSLQSVYQLPPSVTTLCCSNFVPLPPDPPPFLLLFGRLKKKSIRKQPI